VKASLLICLILVLSATGIQTAAVAQSAMPEIRFPEADKAKGGAPGQGSTPQPGTEVGSSAGWVHPSPHHPNAVKSGRDSLADQLNRAELNHLLGAGRDTRGASIR
jgi:hypothetical protein